jgi:DNA-binding MarR family transcriptional regulator
MDDHDYLDPPFRAIGFLLSSVGHAVTLGFQQRLEPLGIEPREFALLRSLGHEEGCTQQACGERLGVHPSRMVALVDGLQERALLERRAHPADRRARALHLTQAGRRLLAEAQTVAAGFERHLVAGLDEHQREALRRALGSVADQLEVPPGVHAAHLEAVATGDGTAPDGR